MFCRGRVDKTAPWTSRRLHVHFGKFLEPSSDACLVDQGTCAKFLVSIIRRMSRRSRYVCQVSCVHHPTHKLVHESYLSRVIITPYQMIGSKIIAVSCNSLSIANDWLSIADDWLTNISSLAWLTLLCKWLAHKYYQSRVINSPLQMIGSQILPVSCD